MAKAPISQTLILTEDGSTIAMTAALAVTIPPFVIDLPPAAGFTEQPAITADSDPTVGEYAAFTFGVANRPFGAKRLYKDGIDVADASNASVQWTEPGAYKLRVYLADGVIFAESGTVTVGAAVEGTVQALGLTFASTNEDGSTYVVGTNPPRLALSIGDGTDKDLYRAIIYYDRAGSGPLAKADARRIVIEDLRAGFDAEAFVTDAVNGLVAGSFRAVVSIQSKTDGIFGPDSAIISTVLNALALPAATSTLDDARKSQYVTLSGDKRTGTGDGTLGALHVKAVTGSRNIATRGEAKIISLGNPNRGHVSGFSLMVPGTDIPAFQLPDGAISTGSGVTADDILSWEVIPAASDGSNSGSFTAWINGAVLDSGPKVHSLSTYEIAVIWSNDDVIRLNTGQEDLAYPSLSSARRYN